MIYLILNLFNMWIPFPKYKPRKNGDYLCIINQPISIYHNKITYEKMIRVLTYDDEWKNKDVDIIFSQFEVKDESGQQIYSNLLSYQKTVVAFKKLPKIL